MDGSSAVERVRRPVAVGLHRSTLIAGLLGGLTVLPTPMSMPAVVFTGQLEPYLSVGIGLALFGTAVICLVFAWRSSCPTALGNAHLAPGLVLGIMASTMVERLGPNAPPEVVFGTLLLLIILSTMALGAIMLVLGWRRLGNLIRYIPYPVTGALLAYVAIRLVRKGLEIMVGHELTLENSLTMFRADDLLHWLPGVLAAAAVIVMQQVRRSHLNIPMAVALVIGLFWLVASFSGATADDLQAEGYLLPQIESSRMWSPGLLVGALGHADWRVVLYELPQFVVLCLVSIVTLLLVASSIEVVTRTDLDLNQELKAAGIANLLGGLGGGLPTYHSVSATTLAYGLGTRSRMVGVIGAAVVVMVLLFAGPLIAYMPKLVLGGGVIFLAFEMAVLRVRSQWRQAPAMDRALLLLVLASLLVFGFLPGIAIGILAGLALFAFSYARIDLVRVAGNGTSFRSNVHRPPAQLKSLAEHADALQVVGLQGYLFFGSTHNLLRRVKAYLVPQPRTQRAFLIFDFARVDGMDGSAVYALTRLVQQAEERGYSVMVAALPMTVANALRKAGLAGVGEAAVRAFPDLDHALEQAENAVLGIDEMVTPQSGLDELEAAYPDVGIRAQLMTYGEPVSWRPGEVAIRQGDPSDSMFFIESGRLTAWRELADGNRARLSTIVPGTVVGELGFYLRSRRAASIIADVESTAFCITRNALRRMETDDPRLASIFHRLMVIVAAERAVSNVGLLDARAGRGDEP